MSSFFIKVIAAVTMLIDHMYYCIPNSSYIFNYIGRISFPLFAYQASIGYLHTKNLKNYCLRLFIFAIISQIPFMLLFETTYLNIFFTLLLGILSLYVWDKCDNKFIGILLVFVLACLAQFFHCDYGAFGVLSIFVFYVFKDKHLFMILSYLILVFFKYLHAFITTNFYYPNIIMFLFTLLPILIIYFYNGKKGKDIKYFLYFFYPVHIMVLYIIKVLI